MPVESIQEIDAELLKLQTERDAIVKQLHDLHKRRDALVNAEHVAHVVAELTPEQRDILLNVASLKTTTDAATASVHTPAGPVTQLGPVLKS